MNLAQAEEIARGLMKDHLPCPPWTFAWDQAPRRFGCCIYDLRRIQLSTRLVSLNDEVQVRACILHEIAHAIAGREAGHGPIWQRICIRIGGDGMRCYSYAQVKVPPKRVVVSLDMLRGS